jgi:hypothetical protein
MDDAANLVDSPETEIPGSSPISVGGVSLDPPSGGASGPDAWLLAEVIAASAATAVALGGGALYLRRRRLR